MNTAAGIGGAIAGVIVARAGYGWLNVVGACLLLPMAALALRRALTRPAAPVAPDSPGAAGTPAPTTDL
jgi:hypothetical protein